MSESERPRAPHAGLFESVFGNPEHASARLQLVLPPGLVARIDWSTLTLCPSKYCDTDLVGSEVDLLFRVRLIDGHPAFLYFLFEHQSTSDRFMALRLLRYEVRIWDAFLRDYPDAKLLPPIVPVVLHHSNAGWSAATSFTDLLDLGSSFTLLAPIVPQFRFLLDDISHASDEELHRGTFLAAVTLGLLRESRRPTDLLAHLERWLATLRAIANAPGGLAALEILMKYAQKAGEIPFPVLHTFAHQIGPTAVEALMTTAEQIAQKARAEGEARGRAEGRAEGKAEGKAALVLRQLGLRFGSLPIEVADRVRSASPDELDLWAERILTATRLDDVFA